MSQPLDLKNWLASADVALAEPGAAAAWLRQSNGRGEYMLAISFARRVAESLESRFSAEEMAPLHQQFALALARSGSQDAALDVLERLHAEGRRDAETLGLLGRVHKDFAEKSSSPEDRSGHLERARDFYLEGFRSHSDTYCGINAAALSVSTGRLEDAKALAAEVLGLLPENGDHWTIATRAEALLILGRTDEAEADYLEAANLAGARRADFASTLRQCRILGRALGGEAARLAEKLPCGGVAVFAGHRPDLPGRRKPRLPAEALPGLRQRLLEWLRENQIRIVYSSAAAGADLVFLDAARELGIETHVFLPYPKEGFLRRSVEECGPAWVEKFEEALAAADTVTVVEDQTPQDDGAALRFCIKLLTAAASSMASAADWPLKPLAVWDGLPAAGPGGTADSVAFWNSAGLAVKILNPLEPARDAVREPSAPVAASRPFASIYAANPDGVGSEIAVLLGLHVGGYENLADSGFVALDRDVFGGVADLLAARGWSASCQGAFGDYIFPWKTTSDAGLASLEILEELERGA
ncbi:MAG: TRAFs-binding domain-containing protein, partial [Verrucomicrobiota bacterium]